MKRLHTYSQHFLRSPSLVKALIGHSKLKKHDLVLDIGAGSGVISSALATRVARVIAIEPEPATAKKLRQNMRRYDNVTIVEADFMTMKLPTEPYNIFANIPFHLSSPIIHRLIDTPTPPQKTYLIVQKQFARKLIAEDARFFTGQLGMLLGARYTVKIRKPLQKTDFWPHPAVDTVFIEILLREDPLVPLARMNAYETFTKECFSDPHTLQKMPLTRAGLNLDAKPSQLSLQQWIALFHAQTRY